MANQSDDRDRIGTPVSDTIGRRQFIRTAAALSAAGILMVGPHAWAARALESDSSRKRLLVVFLRGAVDGLNVVVPYGDSQYYD
jgi:uncharacterized protein (DUF1501 family)